jgi:UTP--glucose-1-phosphate uridylyltransferase
MENQQEIKKIIIPIAGLGTRFLPLSRVISKEFLPLVDKPVIQYIIEEAKKSGIKEVIFVIDPGRKDILTYFKKNPELEKTLIKRKKDKILKELKDFEAVFEGIAFSCVVQKLPLGDGHAILQAAKQVMGQPVAVSFGDDIVDTSEKPAIAQLMDIFKTCQAPVIALKQLPMEKIPAYGVVAVEKIANNLFKIKKIVEKPSLADAPSNLAIVGKYILTPEVFQYLKKAGVKGNPERNGEIVLAEIFDKMLSDGKIIYGCEVKGEWLECGDKIKWLKSFFYLALRDPRFKEELKKYIKEIK